MLKLFIKKLIFVLVFNIAIFSKSGVKKSGV